MGGGKMGKGIGREREKVLRRGRIGRVKVC